MTSIVYFLLLSIALSKNSVNCDEEGFEVEATFLENNEKAVFKASVPRCYTTDLILKYDDKLYEVTKLELKNVCQNMQQTWKLTSEIFKRYTKLADLSIQGPIIRLKNSEARQNLASQLFNLPTITCFHIQDCFPLVAPDYIPWVLPPYLAKLIIQECDFRLLNFNKTANLKYLKIIHKTLSTLPDFAYPSLQELDIKNAKKIHFKVPDIAFFCNLTKFSLDIELMLAGDYCECELLQKWQKHLRTQKIGLTIETGGKPFKDLKCAEPGSCPSSTGPLMEANKSRIRCFSLKPPEVPPLAPTLPPRRESGPSKWPFWVFIVAGFIILSVIFALFMFAAERFSKSTSASEEEGVEGVVDEEGEEE